MTMALAAVGLAGVVSACGGGGGGSGAESGNPNKPVTITYWQGWTDPVSKAGIVKAIKMFEKAHPNIHVKEVDQSGDQKLIAAISGGNPPDASTVFTMRDLGPLAAKGGLHDLNQLAQQYGIPLKQHLADYTPAALKSGTYHDQLYGLTFELDAFALFINKDLFKQAGITQYPKTMSEVAEDSIKLTKSSGGRMSQLGGLIPGYGTSLLEFIWPFFGGQLYNEGTKTVTADSPGMVAALDWEKALVDRLGAQSWSDFLGQKPRNALANLFYDGHVGMSIEGDWSCSLAAKYAPKLNFVAVPPPYQDGHPDYANSTWIDGALNVVPTGSKHPREALELIDFLNSTQAQVAVQNAIGAQSPLKSAGRILSAKRNGCWKLLTSLAEGQRAYPYPVISDALEYQQGLATAEDSVLHGKQTAQQALHSLGQKLQSELQ